jgi:hypothetical protein
MRLELSDKATNGPLCVQTQNGVRMHAQLRCLTHVDLERCCPTAALVDLPAHLKHLLVIDVRIIKCNLGKHRDLVVEPSARDPV